MLQKKGRLRPITGDKVVLMHGGVMRIKKKMPVKCFQGKLCTVSTFGKLALSGFYYFFPSNIDPLLQMQSSGTNKVTEKPVSRGGK